MKENKKNYYIFLGDTKVDVSEAYLEGSLKSTGSVCHEHQHHDECGE